MAFELATTDLANLAPEIALLTMACLILVIDVYLPERLRDLSYQLTQGTLIGTALLVISIYPTHSTLAMSDMFVNDAMGSVLKLFILLIVFFAFVYSRDYLRDRDLLKGEFCLPL